MNRKRRSPRGRVRVAMLRVLLVGSVLLAVPLDAQILPGSPAGPLPRLPLPLPPDLAGAGQVGQVLDELPGSALEELRSLRIRGLLREHRSLLERDPRGEPVVRGQVLALGLDPGARAALVRRGYGLRADDDQDLVLVEVPPGRRLGRALEELRRLAPGALFDYNHLYLPGGAVTGEPPAAASPDPGDGSGPDPRTAVRIGLVDSGVDGSHPVFRGVALRPWGCGDRPVPGPHGTAVASLLAGAAESFRGAAPGATLYAADIYCGQPTGGNLFALAGALAWLSREQVTVINLSLVGPPNRVLEQLVARLVGRGHLVVAAVGNDGPSAPPLYPAAYPGVVGVTAVDGKSRVLLEAGRGAHVDFAAPGAGMAAAGPGGEFRVVRGTSFAAPLVAGLLARDPGPPAPDGAAAALQRLAVEAVDLGARGRDRIYGAGLLARDLGVPPERVGAREPLAF